MKIKLNLNKKEYLAVLWCLRGMSQNMFDSRLVQYAKQEALLKVAMRMLGRIADLKHNNNSLSLSMTEAWAFYTTFSGLEVGDPFTDVVIRHICDTIHQKTI